MYAGHIATCKERKLTDYEYVTVKTKKGSEKRALRLIFGELYTDLVVKAGGTVEPLTQEPCTIKQ